MRWRRRPPRPGALRAYGVPLLVEADDAALWPAIEEILPPEWAPCSPDDAEQRFRLTSSGAETFGLRVGEEAFIDGVELDVAVGALDQQVRLFIAARAPHHVFVHAGVVAVEGRAVLVPGPSFSGKTTLVRALVEAGATYLSDEYALIDPDGRIHPYARRLSIRDEAGAPLREQHVTELGGVAGVRSVPVGLVLLTRFKAGSTFTPVPRPRAEGVVALLANTVPAQERPQESLRALTRAIAAAPVVESDRGEANDVAGQILELARSAPAATLSPARGDGSAAAPG